MRSPTSRSLKILRDGGYLAEVVEKWFTYTDKVTGRIIRKRRDLWGFDILAIRNIEWEGLEMLLVQTTSGTGNASSRVKKVLALPTTYGLVRMGVRCVVHGWRKLKPRGTARELWKCREQEFEDRDDYLVVRCREDEEAAWKRKQEKAAKADRLATRALAKARKEGGGVIAVSPYGRTM